MEGYQLRVLKADNPWLTGSFSKSWYGPFLPDRYVPRLARLDPDHRVCLVVGPRQAGKSTLIWKHLESVGNPALYLNCEEPAIRDWLESPAAVLADLADLVETPVAIFFEEVQRLPEAGLFLKGLVDRRPGVSIFATGSSSFDLESATRESLAGRALRHLLLPFSLLEWAGECSGPALIVREQVQKKLEHMLLYGGYPRVLMAQDLGQDPEKELALQVESFVIRDASDRFHIQRPDALRKILDLAASQIGNLCNFAEWSAVAGVGQDTVADYVHLLEETHILRLLRPFVGGKRAELTRRPKVYFVDNGIRNLLLGGFAAPALRSDLGPLLENFALSEIIKSINPLLDSVKYWRTKSGGEVDFVVEHQGRVLACEIKAGDTRSRLSRAARSFIDAYQPEQFVIVGRHAGAAQQHDKTTIRFVQMIELAPLIRSFAETSLS